MIKVMIVEDESIIRKGIICLINWEELDCTIVEECSNALHAMEFLKSNSVDLIITDIVMPQISGLELCEYVNLNYPNTKIIILSAHSDFSYAQTAIKNKVNDYILKSNFVKELPTSVAKTCALIKKENEYNDPLDEEYINKLKIILVKNLIEDNLIDFPSEQECIKLLRMDLQNYYIIMSEIEYMKLPEQEDDYYTPIEKLYGAALNELENISLWIDKHIFLTIVNFNDKNSTTNLQKIVPIMNHILSMVNNYMSFQLNIGISKQHSNISHIKRAYNEASSTLNKLFVDNSLSLYKDTKDKNKTNYLPCQKEVVQTIIENIQTGNQEKYINCIKDIFNTYLNYTDNYDKIKIEILIIISNCFRIIIDNDLNIKNFEQFENVINSNILQAKSLSSLFTILQNWGLKVMELDKSVNFNYNSLVLKVNDYIKDNYSSVVKLNDIAVQLHVNSSYLSRLYKKQTGDSIITTVNKYRINKAKELLNTGNYLISEVGSLVGIDDPAYFSNIFTKHVGVSPKNYKLGS
ncbi:DNA-binding response regulator [Clostridium butyricum]|uniref:Stage 0 sporulation protein A homolog n=1 Tax=Clostridium butyricum TaxID=1492 RepID=A0A512TQZ8_CLOBU|nr:response regulator [Clostridium butyricum]NOW21828.1 two-component system response regulator YesN [Clostridium butyricum]GEQ22682.1 DNA-binding response regulator [Clostridium butyricum]